ncbi:ras-related C3 botulinum toxin substrate 1-like [Clavelina lepadiformis]|uniref:ras-related C3 botulinum toxin substrate 1-like n=1 Tax=Clavelina lepadiformis TaxID=159417 RepID=UPI004042C2EB
MEGPIALDVVTVGDMAVGKTALCVACKSGEFLEVTSPTVLKNRRATIVMEGTIYNLSLWDTSGCANFDSLRSAFYPCTKVFLVAFSVVDRTSFKNVIAKWIPEIRHHCRNPNILLVGTKIDLRNDPDILEELFEERSKPLEPEEGIRLAEEIGAVRYMECSSRTKEGVCNVFCEAIRIFLKQDAPESTIHDVLK